MKNILKFFCNTLLLIFCFSNTYAKLIENKDYKIIEKPIKQIDQNKIEITELFAYYCIHCYDLYPFLKRSVENFPEDVYLRPIHVVWSPETKKLARLAAAAINSGNYEIITPKIFDAIVNKKINLLDDDILKQWVKNQKDFNSNLFLKIYFNDKTIKDVDNMENFTIQHNISATPVIIVGGKYLLISKANLSQADFIKKMDELIEKVRIERNLPPPKKLNFTPSKSHIISNIK